MLKVMHIGGKNLGQDYTMEHDEIHSIVEKTEVERYFTL